MMTGEMQQAAESSRPSKASKCQWEERPAEGMSDYSGQSELSSVARIVVWALRTFGMSGRCMKWEHMRGRTAEVQVAKLDADSRGGERMLVDRHILVEVRI